MGVPESRIAEDERHKAKQASAPGLSCQCPCPGIGLACTGVSAPVFPPVLQEHSVQESTTVMSFLALGFQSVLCRDQHSIICLLPLGRQMHSQARKPEPAFADLTIA